MLGFAQLSFVVNIDRWGKGRAENEAMYGVDMFLYGRELCPNEIIRRLQHRWSPTPTIIDELSTSLMLSFPRV